VWVKDLQEGTYGLFDALFVASLYGFTQLDALAHFLVAVGVLELIVKGLGEVIRDKAVAVGEVLATVLRHFPAGQIAGKAVLYCQVKLFGQGLEQVVDLGVHNLLHRQVEVAHKRHGGIGDHLNAPREAAVGHKVFHDLDGVLIFDLDTTYLIKGNGIPEAHQANLAALGVIEKGRFGSLATANQGGVRRELTEEVGFTGAARP